MDTNSIQSEASVGIPVPVPNNGVFRHTACSPILAILADNPHTGFGIRDLGRAIDRPHRSVSLAVSDLESLGLVTTTTDGRKKLVQINRDRLTKPDDPIVAIPQDEFRDPVRALVNEIRVQLDEVSGILLFGSVARGEADRRSDIDCFVLVQAEKATNQRRAHEIAQSLGAECFDGDRYSFHILVESTKSATRYGDRLREIFVEGYTLYESEILTDLKTEVLTNGQ